MLDLKVDALELVLRAAVVYLALFLMVRLSGKRTVGQFTPFDLLVVMLLSEAVGNALNGGDDSLPGGLILAAALIVMNGAIGFLGSRSARVEKLLEGEPVVIGRDGQWFESTLRRHRLSRPDADKALREADCELRDMRLALLETDGSISVLKRPRS